MLKLIYIQTSSCAYICKNFFLPFLFNDNFALHFCVPGDCFCHKNLNLHCKVQSKNLNPVMIAYFSFFLRRGLTPPHRIKSISMASFSPQEMEFLQSHGNEVYIYCIHIIFITEKTLLEIYWSMRCDPILTNTFSTMIYIIYLSLYYTFLAIAYFQ